MQRHRPTTQEDIDRARERRAELVKQPSVQLSAGFALSVDVMAASIVENGIHITIKVQGIAQRPEAFAEVIGHTTTLFVPATVERFGEDDVPENTR